MQHTHSDESEIVKIEHYEDKKGVVVREFLLRKPKLNGAVLDNFPGQCNLPVQLSRKKIEERINQMVAQINKNLQKQHPCGNARRISY